MVMIYGSMEVKEVLYPRVQMRPADIVLQCGRGNEGIGPCARARVR